MNTIENSTFIFTNNEDTYNKLKNMGFEEIIMGNSSYHYFLNCKRIPFEDLKDIHFTNRYFAV